MTCSRRTASLATADVDLAGRAAGGVTCRRSQVATASMLGKAFTAQLLFAGLSANTYLVMYSTSCIFGRLVAP